MKEQYRIIGLMSGTSLDGLDIACVLFTKKDNGNTEPDWDFTVEKATTAPYPDIWKERLKGAFHSSAEQITALDADYGHYLGRQTSEFIREHSLEKIDCIASHGHTVFHRPDLNYTLQIGSGAHLHAACGLPAICDFRTLDVALGGQGAPLVPIGDKLLFGQYDYCLNIGGFANISFDDSRGKRIAYDICPANFTLNRLMRTLGEEYDRQGQTARSARLNKGLFDKLNALPYYVQKPPKSLAQEWVEAHIMPLLEKYPDSVQNHICTLTHHTALQIARNISPGKTVLATGGGVYNKYLTELIGSYGQGIHVVIPESLTVDYKEALIFAFLGLRRILGKANALSSVTGARKDSSCGVCFGF